MTEIDDLRWAELADEAGERCSDEHDPAERPVQDDRSSGVPPGDGDTDDQPNLGTAAAGPGSGDPRDTGSTVTRSAVTGSAVTGSAVTGSSVTGSSVTGSAVTRSADPASPSDAWSGRPDGSATGVGGRGRTGTSTEARGARGVDTRGDASDDRVRGGDSLGPAADYDAGDDPATQVRGGPSTPPMRGLPKLPVRKAAIPAWVLEHGNGMIPEASMIKVAPIGAGLLVPEAAARWRSLQLAAQSAGFALTMTGAYRTYAQQESLFLQRYGTEPTTNGSKEWNGVVYHLRGGMAMASVPGRSNHGWGAAVDCAVGGYGRSAAPVTSDGRFVSWFIANAPEHGWSWETQSEPWHIRLVSIDTSDTSGTMARLTDDASNNARTTVSVAAPPSIPTPTLRVGSRGGQVALLQTWCHHRGWGDVGRADGVFGPRTETGVKAMQTEIGTVDDGVYGPKTAAALGRATGSSGASA